MKFRELLRGAQATVEKILAPKKEEKIECAIDDEVVDCSEVDSTPFTGIPAPAYLPEDPWFGPTPKAPALGDNFQVPTNGETGGGGGHNG